MVGHRITGRYPDAVNCHLGIGWEFVNVCMDGTSRVAFAQVGAARRVLSPSWKLLVAYFSKLGIRLDA